MKILVSFLLFFIVSVGLSQTTDAFVYRAAVLDSAGQGRSNENFEVAIRIQDGATPNEKLQYSERHLVETDDLGWYQVKIGSGETADMYNILSDVDWNTSKKNLYIIVKELDGRVVSNSITEIVDSPTLSFATNVESKALLTLDCLTNLNALRELEAPANGDMVCIKGHTFVRDGGEGFFYYNATLIKPDDNGIFIKPKNVDEDNPGRWVRHLDGYINVNYFGISAGRKNRGNYTSKTIQSVIDFAASNKSFSQTNFIAGNTVFFPSGEYVIDGSLIVKTGVKILGEENTLLTASKNATFDYFFKMDAGKVIISIENLRINGNGEDNVGGIYFKSRDGNDGTGGLWQSRFKNINIVNVQGHGIHLEGSDTFGINGPRDYSIPNQLSVFENVRVTRVNDNANSLRMTQYQGQMTFINCLFLGKRDRSLLGTNVFISQPGGHVVSFINCTIQESVYGFKMEGASNVTIDNCWFENLYSSVEVKNCSNIRLVNNRFSNAAGYGSEGFTGPVNLPEGIENSSVITSENSSISVELSLVRVTDVNAPEAHKSTFIYGRPNSESLQNTNKISTRDNEFADARLSRTIGIVQTIPVNIRTINVDGRNKVAANFDNNKVLRKIESTVGGGEQITLTILKPIGNGTVKIKDWEGKRRKGNISLNGETQITLSHGQKVTFLKVDAPLSNNGDEAIYKLISVSN